MEDFINQGVQAIVTIAVAPDGFDRIIRLADKNNVVVVPFDNILDTDKVMMVNEDQKEMGRQSARWIMEQSGKTSGDILEVRGLPGNSVDRDRHVGFREVMEAAPNKRSYIRLAAIRALLMNLPRATVCQMFDRTDRMVRLWIECFNRGGIDALISRPKPGRPRGPAPRR